MTKEKYLSYCVGYIHYCVITENLRGNKQFNHNYENSYFMYGSAEEFNQSLLEKLQLMFPDANIVIKEIRWLNVCLSCPTFYLISIS